MNKDKIKKKEKAVTQAYSVATYLLLMVKVELIELINRSQIKARF
jgi:hypothetical protein